MIGQTTSDDHIHACILYPFMDGSYPSIRFLLNESPRTLLELSIFIYKRDWTLVLHLAPFNLDLLLNRREQLTKDSCCSIDFSFSLSLHGKVIENPGSVGNAIQGGTSVAHTQLHRILNGMKLRF